MGVQQEPQGSLFYVGFNLEKRVRRDHPLRKVQEQIDFDFVCQAKQGQRPLFPFPRSPLGQGFQPSAESLFQHLDK